MFCHDSVELSVWSAATTPAIDWRDHVFDIGEVIYVSASIVNTLRDEFSIAEFSAVTVRAVSAGKGNRRRPSSFMLLGLLPKPGTVSKTGRMCELAIDSVDSEPYWRGFHFKLKKSNFDFRMYREQKDVLFDLMFVFRIRGRRPRDFFEVTRSVRIRVGSFEPDGMHHLVKFFAPEGINHILNRNQPYRGTKKRDPVPNLMWVHRIQKALHHHLEELLDMPDRYVALNHLPHEAVFGQKDEFAVLLKQVKEASLFFPVSYRIGIEEEKAEFVALLEESHGDEVWIMKSPWGSQGIGTTFLRKNLDGRYSLGGKDMDSLESALAGLPKLKDQREYVAQKYIRNPVLHEGRKMEIREYWLIASVVPLRVLRWDTGLCLFSAEQYRLGDFDMSSIHLTNAARQTGKKDKAPKALRVQDVHEYLQNQPEPFDFEGTVREQARSILKTVALAFNDSIPDFSSYHRLHLFALYGADFVMDADDHRLWLTEIQVSPGFSIGGAVSIKKTFFPHMVVETLDIVEELRRYEEMHGSSEGLRDLESVREFEWLIGGPEEGR